MEALRSPPEAVITSSPEWRDFVALIDPVSLMHRAFVDRCLGQAMGGLMKKKKDAGGKLVVKGDVTPTKFCDSFRYVLPSSSYPLIFTALHRLLSYVACARSRKPISPWVPCDQIDGSILCALTEMFEVLPPPPLPPLKKKSLVTCIHPGAWPQR